MARRVVGAVAAATIEPVVLQRKIDKHDIPELGCITQKVMVIGHMLKNVAHDYGIESPDRYGAKVAAAKIDLWESRSRRLDVGTGNIYSDPSSALTDRHCRYQFTSCATYLEDVVQAQARRHETHQVRQFEEADFDVDLRLLERAPGAACNIFRVFVVERGIVDRRE